MANDRMFLLHHESGYFVPLAKHMGWGWYGVSGDLKAQVEELFDMVKSQEAEGDQYAFCIAFEGDERLKYRVEKEKSDEQTRK